MKLEFKNSREIRAEKFLADELPFLKRSFLQKLFRKREIKVEGIAQKVDSKIQPNSIVEIFLPEPRKYFTDLTGNAIIFEDENVIAFDKRAGIPTHSGIGTRGDDLKNCARILLKRNLIVIHRIDRATSGVVIFAKNQKTARKLEDEFRERRAEKIYHAVVEGRPPLAGVSEKKILRMGKKMELSEKGVAAKTLWKVVRKLGRNSLLEIRIETGRMHQIRVHLAAAGFPVVGDALYPSTGSGQARRATESRMLLHSSSLKILGYTFEAKLPEEFLNF
jgi:23S rRNA pseudouridine1911/1915/1917 synthase